jgi:membrane-bound lytic murein transglycosylase MltF
MISRMISREKLLKQLEEKRATLNQKLMKTRSLREANRIERELWALRAAIAYHTSHQAKPESPRAVSPTAL